MAVTPVLMPASFANFYWRRAGHAYRLNDIRETMATPMGVVHRLIGSVAPATIDVSGNLTPGQHADLINWYAHDLAHGTRYFTAVVLLGGIVQLQPALFVQPLEFDHTRGPAATVVATTLQTLTGIVMPLAMWEEVRALGGFDAALGAGAAIEYASRVLPPVLEP